MLSSWWSRLMMLMNSSWLISPIGSFFILNVFSHRKYLFELTVTIFVQDPEQLLGLKLVLGVPVPHHLVHSRERPSNRNYVRISNILRECSGEIKYEKAEERVVSILQNFNWVVIQTFKNYNGIEIKHNSLFWYQLFSLENLSLYYTKW